MDQNPTTQGTSGTQGNATPSYNTTPTAGGVGNAVPGQTAPMPSPQSSQHEQYIGGPSGSVVAPAQPRKKHTGLIITIVIVLILVLGGAGFAIWYFVIFNSPENIALSAVDQFLKAGPTSTTGTITIASSSDSQESQFKINLEAGPRSLPGSTNLSVDISVTAQPSEVDVWEYDTPLQYNASLDFGTVVMADGIVYFRVDKLLESLDDYMDLYAQVRSEVEETPTPAEEAVFEALYDLVETVDGEWWQVSLEDLLNTFDAAISSADRETIEDGYACYLNAIKDDYDSDFVKIYNNNQFVQIAKTDAPSGLLIAAQPSSDLPPFYSVKVDYDKLASFANASTHSQLFHNIENCTRQIAEANGFATDSIGTYDEVLASDFEDSLLDDFDLYLGISNWDHKLRRLFAEYEDDDTYSAYSIVADLAFDYDAVSTIAAPSEYSSVTELVEPVNNFVETLIDAIFKVFTPDYSTEDPDSSMNNSDNRNLQSGVNL